MYVIPYHFFCSCHEEATSMKLCLTSLGTIMAEWICTKCHAVCQAHLDLYECIEQVPHDPSKIADDNAFLTAMHITPTSFEPEDDGA